MQIRRILCPSDFSDSSERALAFAVDLLSGQGGEVETLHVFEARPYIAPPGQPHTDEGAQRYFERLHQDMRAELERAAVRHEQPDVKLSFSSCHGLAEDEIAARSQDFDLIVMATHSRTRVARFFFGSVAARVLAHSKCPVLTLPAEVDVRGL